MSEEGAVAQMAEFIFPTAEEQLDNYFNESGMASVAIGVVGWRFRD